MSDFAGDAAGKNPPASSGDTGSIPGPGRFHMLQGNESLHARLLSPSAATPEAHEHRACSPQWEKVEQWEALEP